MIAGTASTSGQSALLEFEKDSRVWQVSPYDVIVSRDLGWQLVSAEGFSNAAHAGFSSLPAQ
jgi:hypothetical protein